MTQPATPPPAAPAHASARAAMPRAHWALLLTAIFLIAGCAAQSSRSPDFEDPSTVWTGRLSLQIASQPPQLFAAGFELRGGADAGQLQLLSPLGNILAALEWAPGQATLLEGGGPPQSYPSLDALTEALTGAALPVPALLQWLAGRPATAPGWQPDLSRAPEGRLSAVREQPLPQATLRVVLDPR